MKKFELPTLDLQFFRDAEACYDPATVLDEGWTGTALDILQDETIPSKDRIWAASCKSAMPSGLQRLCAVASVMETKVGDGVVAVYDLLDDERSRNALIVAKAHALGEATDAELDAAEYAARCAATDAATDAGLFAAWSASGSAKWGAKWGAAWSVAGSAAEYATRCAATDAGLFAAWGAMPGIWARTIKTYLK